MASIDPLQAALHAGSQLQSPQQKPKKTERKKSLFSSLLTETEESQTLSSLPRELANLPKEEALQVLIDSVYTAGDLLKEKPYVESFVSYKKQLLSFYALLSMNHLNLKNKKVLYEKIKQEYL